ncbi:MAG: hypothetical protein R3B89_00785 [Polyangiaceae bacterium]
MSGYDTEALTEGQLGALIEIMFLAAFADGEFSAQEQDNFREVVSRLGDSRLTSDVLSGLMLRAAVQLEREGRSARLAAARTELQDLDARRIALALAADVAGADGIESREREQLKETAKALEISDAELARLVGQA